MLFVIYQTCIRPVQLEKLSLSSLDGKNVNLDSLLDNKHTVFNFWATWCKPCIEEMPMLDSVNQQLDRAKWQIILVSDESAEMIAAFKDKRILTMPFYKLDQKIGEIGISGLPKTVIVDEQKKVLYTKTGGLTMGSGKLLELLRSYE